MSGGTFVLRRHTSAALFLQTINASEHSNERALLLSLLSLFCRSFDRAEHHNLTMSISGSATKHQDAGNELPKIKWSDMFRELMTDLECLGGPHNATFDAVVAANKHKAMYTDSSYDEMAMLRRFFAALKVMRDRAYKRETVESLERQVQVRREEYRSEKLRQRNEDRRRRFGIRGGGGYFVRNT